MRKGPRGEKRPADVIGKDGRATAGSRSTRRDGTRHHEGIISHYRTDTRPEAWRL
jgi:hypothetical protein